MPMHAPDHAHHGQLAPLHTEFPECHLQVSCLKNRELCDEACSSPSPDAVHHPPCRHQTTCPVKRYKAAGNADQISSQACHPKHRPSYHTPQPAGRMSMGGGRYVQPPELRNMEAPSERRPSLPGYNHMSHVAEMGTTSYERTRHNSVDFLPQSNHDHEGATALLQFSHGVQDQALPCRDPLPCLEPPLSAGTSQASTSPQTPLSGASHARANSLYNPMNSNTSSRTSELSGLPRRHSSINYSPDYAYPSRYYNPSPTSQGPPYDYYGYPHQHGPAYQRHPSGEPTWSSHFHPAWQHQVIPVQPTHQPNMMAPPPPPSRVTGANGPQVGSKRRCDEEEPENEEAPPPKKKVQREKVDEDRTCFFAGCKNVLVPFRKCVSQFFGRNKRNTKAMPKETIPVLCRKCYQQQTYRRHGKMTKAAWQAHMIEQGLANSDKYENTRDWKIHWDKRLTAPINEYIRDHQPGRRRSTSTLASVSQSEASPDPSLDDESEPEDEDDEKVINKKPDVDGSIIRFCLQLESQHLIGTHKTTQDCHNVLRQMARFAKTHRSWRNYLPDIEFLPDNNWPGNETTGFRLKKGEKLIITEDDVPQEAAPEETGAVATTEAQDEQPRENGQVADTCPDIREQEKES